MSDRVHRTAELRAASEPRQIAAVETFAERAYRRPLSSVDRDELTATSTSRCAQQDELEPPKMPWRRHGGEHPHVAAVLLPARFAAQERLGEQYSASRFNTASQAVGRLCVGPVFTPKALAISRFCIVARMRSPSGVNHLRRQVSTCRRWRNTTALERRRHCNWSTTCSRHWQHLAPGESGFICLKSNKLGFVAAKPIPQVLRNINAFTLGARSVNPKATTTVIFTGEWSMPVKEADATNSLCDNGIDVITCHVDSPKSVVENAVKRNIYVCGYHCSQATLAPKNYLTGAEWNWEKVYTDYVKMMQDGKKIPNMLRGGLKAGIVKTSPYGDMVPDDVRKKADDVKAQFMKGDFVIYKGPLKANDGKEILPAGKDYVQTDPMLEKMDWLVDGVIGKK